MASGEPGVYVLELQTGYFYVGHSKDVTKRIREHFSRTWERVDVMVCRNSYIYGQYYGYIGRNPSRRAAFSARRRRFASGS